MSATSTLASIKKTIKQKGGPAMVNARKTLLQYTDDSYNSQALRYLSKKTLQNALPVFPALVSWAYEAVGGSDDGKTTPFGEALLLISFAADLHDDIIDQSLTKGSKRTVLGEFNVPTTILAGDILLSEGLSKFTKAVNNLPADKSQQMQNILSNSIKEICTAEALQLKLKNKPYITPEDYLKVIDLKSVVPQVCMQIGAMLGTDDVADVENIGQYGRIYGVNTVIVEEFADLLNVEEFDNRLKNEIAPLPMIYSIQNIQIRTKISDLLSSGAHTSSIHNTVVDLILNSAEVEKLHQLMISNVAIGKTLLQKSAKGKVRAELENLLLVPLTYFES